MTKSNYIRYFETSEANYNALVEVHGGPESKIQLRPTKQNDAIRIEGPLSEKETIDQIVSKYDESVGW